jgi:hypothetical protein
MDEAFTRCRVAGPGVRGSQGSWGDSRIKETQNPPLGRVRGQRLRVGNASIKTMGQRLRKQVGVEDRSEVKG